MVVDQDKIHRLSLSKNIRDREYAAIVLKEEFKSLPVKFAAWDDLHRLTSDDNSHVRRNAALALGSALEHLPEEYTYDVWEDLHSLTKDKDWWVRGGAASVISHIFPFVPDEKKYEAWEDLIWLICDENSWVRDRAASKLIDNCPLIPDDKKNKAWKDLIRLTSYGNIDIQKIVIHALGHVFKYIPDKNDAWNDLHRLINNWPIRKKAISVLYYAFEDILDENKCAAWDDLHLLITDKSPEVRKEAVKVLGYAYSSVPDKSTAWEDLHKLIKDGNPYVRWEATKALGYAYSSVPDKSTAWKDLHDLTKDEKLIIKVIVASVIGSVFKDIPDEFKSNAWKDLTELTHSGDSNVRAYAKHSLGKVCIYKASTSESETDSRNILEEAIRYFEDAAKYDIRNNPAEFCLLFYRSFNAVLFKKIHSKKEICTYITAAKMKIGKSESRKKLLEAVEKLAEALEIAYTAHEYNSCWQKTLKSCSDICNKVDQLMDENKDKTPAIKKMYENARPSFKKNIKEIIADIKNKADAACEEARGTQFEKVACGIKKEVETWTGAEDKVILNNISRFIEIINTYMPPEKSRHMCIDIDNVAKERNISQLFDLMIDDFYKILNVNNHKMDEILFVMKELNNIKESFAPKACQKIVITSGIEFHGTGAVLQTEYPIHEVPTADFKEVLYDNPKKSIKNLTKGITKYGQKKKQNPDKNT